MYISAEVEDEEIFREAMYYLYRIDENCFKKVCENLFESNSVYIRDLCGLILSHIDDKSFLDIVKIAYDKEKVVVLKKDLELVLNQLSE